MSGIIEEYTPTETICQDKINTSTEYPQVEEQKIITGKILFKQSVDIPIESTSTSKELILTENGQTYHLVTCHYPSDIKKIDLSNKGITEIVSVEDMPGVEEINLSGNAIEKISHINKMTNLVKLDMSKNKIKKIEELDGLKNLKELNLHDNEIEEISDFKELINMRKFNSSCSKMALVKQDDDYFNSQILMLLGMYISVICDLEKIIKHKINEGKVSGNMLKVMTEIAKSKLPKVDGLDNLKASKCTHILKREEGFDFLDNLNNFIEQYNQNKKKAGLNSLTELEVLDISKNKLTYINGLDNQTKLKSLKLSENKIEKIEGLGATKELETLDLSHNCISEMSSKNEVMDTEKKLKIIGDLQNVIKDSIYDVPYKMKITLDGLNDMMNERLKLANA